MSWVLAIDLGGTRIRAGLVDREGRVRARRETPTQAREGPDSVIGRMVALARELLSEAEGSVRAVGVGAPGPLDPEAGVILSAPNLPGWRGVPLRDRLEEALGLPVFLGNDANVAALAEARWGAGRGLRHLVYLTVSTGIGGGVLVDGRLLLGDRGLAGELGHLPVEVDGPPCGCGGRGHLEAIASGTALAREAEALAASGASPYLAARPAPRTAADLGEAARSGDPAAQAALRRAGEALGAGLVAYLHLFSPQKIVLGGGVALGLGELLVAPARARVQRDAMPPYRQVPIVYTGLGDDVGLLGAAALAWTEGGEEARSAFVG